MLVRVLRESFKMRGAEALVRRYGFEVVNGALADYGAVKDGCEVRNPAGLLVFLVREAYGE
jgi:hypothetical protein